MSRSNYNEPAQELPPHSMEIEQGVLGCILIGGVDELAQARAMIKGREWFYDMRHQEMWEAICAMDDAQIPIELITLCQRLKDNAQLEGVGGSAYVSSLCDAVPSAKLLPTLMESLREKWAQRIALSETAMLASRIRAGGADLSAEEQILRTTEALQKAADSVSSQQTMVPMKRLVRDAIDAIQFSTEHRNQGLVHGALSTGFGYYDKKTSGLRPTELTILGGRPSTGKTSWLCSLLVNLCVKGKVPVLFFSLEMSRAAITERVLCAAARANLRQIHSGMCSKADLQRLTTVMPDAAGAPLYIDDTHGLTPTELIARARRWVPMYGIRLVLIDHLHEVSVPEARGDEKIQATEGAKAGKAIAKRLNVPVIMAAQLSRQFEQEQAKSRMRMPRMTDLRGSGYIEQIADVIGILHRDESAIEGEEDNGKRVARPQWGDLDEWPVNLEICKQRNGPTGKVEFTFHRSFMLYEDRHLNRGDAAEANRVRGRETWEET